MRKETKIDGETLLYRYTTKMYVASLCAQCDDIPFDQYIGRCSTLIVFVYRYLLQFSLFPFGRLNTQYFITIVIIFPDRLTVISVINVYYYFRRQDHTTSIVYRVSLKDQTNGYELMTIVGQ